MLHLRKLSLAEIAAQEQTTLNARAEVARAYDALLDGFAAGEWGRVELDVGERRVAVRARLQAAARRRGLALRFRPGPGPMIFCVEQGTIVLTDLPAAAKQLSESPKPPPAPEPPTARTQRRPRGERRAAGRYEDVLPRWMREGERKGRR